jgi:adenylate kinase family enzyme
VTGVTHPARVWFIGNSGSGKSTAARQFARATHAPCIELDSLFHQPNWTPTPAPEFRRRVREALASNEWAVDGNYKIVRDLMVNNAEVIVAFDLPRGRNMRQLVARTWRRIRTREELWGTNRESVSAMLRWRPEDNIVRWGWTNHPRMRGHIRWLVHTLGDRVIVIRTQAELDDLWSRWGIGS